MPDIIPLLSMAILVSTIGTFIFAIGSYIKFKMGERKPSNGIPVQSLNGKIVSAEKSPKHEVDAQKALFLLEEKKRLALIEEAKLKKEELRKRKEFRDNIKWK